jgi:probable phosphoglycerate mutase
MRHGEAAYHDAAGRPVANTDVVGLTEHGRDQSIAAADWFCTMGVRRFDRVITSPLPRARQTGAQVLRRMGLGIEAQSWSELREIGSTAAGGGETRAQARGRVATALARLYAERGWDTALIVAHGGINELILSDALGVGASGLSQVELDPGCINVLDLGPAAGEWVVRAVNLCPDSAAYWTRQTGRERRRAESLK